MSTQPSRQPKGIPAGGQFAPDTHEEPSIQLPRASTFKPIIATVHLQEWINDYAVTQRSIDFDATRILADMTEQDREIMEDASDEADEVYREAVRRGLAPDHDGPFDVSVRDALDGALAEDPDILTKAAAAPANRPLAAVLDKPLSAYEIGARADENGWVEGLAALEVSDLIDNDLEGHLDMLGDKLVGSELLMEPNATPVRVAEDGSIIFRIKGDASAIIDDFDEDELADFEAGQAENSQQGA